MQTMDVIDPIGIKWPCLKCGSDIAPKFQFNGKTGEVIECANCGLRKDDRHLESPMCWCLPRLYHRKEGDADHWVHNQLQ